MPIDFATVRQGVLGRARPKGPALKWPVCDVIGVYRNLMYVPHGVNGPFRG